MTTAWVLIVALAGSAVTTVPQETRAVCLANAAYIEARSREQTLGVVAFCIPTGIQH